MADRVITGALIKISVTPKGQGTNRQTEVIGRAMAMNVQEQYRVQPVFGIGNIVAQELPVLQYSGAFSIQQFGFSRTAVQNLMNQFARKGSPTASDTAAFVRQLLYTEGVDVTVTRREKQGTQEVEVPLAMISGAICTGESMNIQENQVVMRDGSFIFAEPVAVSAA